MPPRSGQNNVLFLFQCIESSGVKIDFGKVGSVLGVKTNAAYMRYTRLRKNVGDDPTISSHATQSTAPQTSVAKVSRSAQKKRTTKKRKRVKEADEVCEEGDAQGGDMGDGFESDDNAENEDESSASKPARRTCAVPVGYFEDSEETDSIKEDGSDDQVSEYEDGSSVSEHSVNEAKPNFNNEDLKNGVSGKLQQAAPVREVHQSPKSQFQYHKEANVPVTPPPSAKRIVYNKVNAEDARVKVRADLMEFSSGYRIAETPTKRQKLVDGRGSVEVASSSLVRTATSRANMEQRDTTSSGPNEVKNIKVIHEKAVARELDVDKLTIGEEGRTRWERLLSRFWR